MHKAASHGSIISSSKVFTMPRGSLETTEKLYLKTIHFAGSGSGGAQSENAISQVIESWRYIRLDQHLNKIAEYSRKHLWQ